MDDLLASLRAGPAGTQNKIASQCTARLMKFSVFKCSKRSKEVEEARPQAINLQTHVYRAKRLWDQITARAISVLRPEGAL
jgi:hypothetical protein